VRRFRPGSGDSESDDARVVEAKSLDAALSAVGSKFSLGYAQRLLSLDDAICSFVDGLRGENLGAAQVLISLKEHLAATAKLSGDVDEFAIRRCIKRYYES
jgi:hypothetical protein